MGSVVRSTCELLAVAAPSNLGLAGHRARELVRAAVGDDAAAREDQDAVGELFRFVEVVRREQDRRVFQIREPTDQPVEVPPRLGIEAGGRLVEEEQLRPSDDPDRDIESPPLSAGEGADLLVRLLLEPDQCDQLLHVIRAGPIRA